MHLNLGTLSLNPRCVLNMISYFRLTSFVSSQWPIAVGIYFAALPAGDLNPWPNIKYRIIPSQNATTRKQSIHCTLYRFS